MSKRQVIPFYGDVRQNLSDLPKAITVRAGIRGPGFHSLPFTITTYILTVKRRHSLSREIISKKNYKKF